MSNIQTDHEMHDVQDGSDYEDEYAELDSDQDEDYESEEESDEEVIATGPVEDPKEKEAIAQQSQTDMRKQIQLIQNDTSMSAAEKAKRVQVL